MNNKDSLEKKQKEIAEIIHNVTDLKCLEYLEEFIKLVLKKWG